MRRVRRAFTLIELLVVIAIIAILAAILFPVFAKARENARKTQCLSNLNQIAKACIAYSTDYDQYMPVVGWVFRTPPPQPTDPLWTALIMPYVKNTGVFLCASASEARFGATWVDRGRLPYGLNWHWGFPYVSTRDYIVQINRLTRPAASILVLDSVPFDPGASPLGGYLVMPVGFQGTTRVTPVNNNGGFSARHIEGTNVSFADGHSKWYKSEQLVARRSDGTLILAPWDINGDGRVDDADDVVFDCNPAKLKWAVHVGDISCP